MATQQNVKYICDRCGNYAWTDIPNVLPRGWSRKAIKERRYDLCQNCTHEYNAITESFLNKVVKQNRASR